MILDWKLSPNILQFNGCFSLNFGYQETNLYIPQLAMTPDSDINLNFDSPMAMDCLIVMIGGKYLNRVGDVMEKVNDVTNAVGVKPLAVFLISNRYNEAVFIDVDYGFDRYKHSPVMVKLNRNSFTQVARSNF